MSDTMIDRESVIRQLTQHIARADYIETDWMDCVSVPMLRGALALLKAQEPRVLTLDEVKAIGTQNFNQMRDENTRLIWNEERNTNALNIAKPTYYDYGLEDNEEEEPIVLYYIGTDFYDHFNQNRYGKDWRCWSAKPTDEQRESVKWVG